MSETTLWMVGTAAIAAVFGFAAVLLWLLERATTVPPYRQRNEEGQGSATDAVIILGGVLVMASAVLEPRGAAWILSLGLALVALGAAPFQRTPRERRGLRLLGLLLALAVHAFHFLG